MPSSAAQSSMLRSCRSDNIATMSSTPLAPALRAATICTGSTRKSLHMTGVAGTAATTSSRWSSAPSKRVGSVSTDIAAAPPSTYSVARFARLFCSIANCPSAGERFLISAMMPNVPGSIGTTGLSSSAGRMSPSAAARCALDSAICCRKSLINRNAVADRRESSSLRHHR